LGQFKVTENPKDNEIINKIKDYVNISDGDEIILMEPSSNWLITDIADETISIMEKYKDINCILINVYITNDKYPYKKLIVRKLQYLGFIKVNISDDYFIMVYTKFKKSNRSEI
jgi:hypothetical protein